MAYGADAGPSTRAVHAGEPPAEVYGPVVSPIVLSSTFFSAPDGDGPVLYQRYGNAPNHVLLARRLAALEGGEDAIALASGMAAMACALLSLVRAGDHVLATDAIYGGTRVLLSEELARLGIETTYVDLTSPGWENGFRPDTKVVLGESPSNPLLRVL
ncbi:MAG TPA: PLP-dependent transferase, partial [Longimicrobiaceae bacterium]|nr:PLP-dependent transferase [Longimicrobiaceae bacterium]